jgi:hypothetical protein
MIMIKINSNNLQSHELQGAENEDHQVGDARVNTGEQEKLKQGFTGFVCLSFLQFHISHS